MADPAFGIFGLRGLRPPGPGGPAASVIVAAIVLISSIGHSDLLVIRVRVLLGVVRRFPASGFQRRDSPNVRAGT